MTKEDKRKIISYFELLERAEGNGMVLEIGTIITNLNYERGCINGDITGVVMVDVKLTHDNDTKMKETK